MIGVVKATNFFSVPFIPGEGQLIFVKILDDGNVSPRRGQQSFQARYKVPEVDGLPRFNGGLVGYFGYDIVRYIEQRLDKLAKPDPIGTPDIMLMV